MTGPLWILFGLGAALGLASADALTKKYFTGLSPYGMSLVRLLYTQPFLLVGWLFFGVPPLDWIFVAAVAAALPLEVLANLAYMRALKVSPLSLCTPLMAFTPVFLILVGHLILGELPNAWGAAGIIGVAAGSYVLNLDRRRQGWLAPLIAIWHQEGPRFMLLASVIYAATSALGKLAVLHSAPGFFGLFYPLVFTGIMLLGYPASLAPPGRQLLARPWVGLLLGLCFAGSILCHMHGIEMAPAAYLIALKRTSLLFSVLYGGLWLREANFRQRFLGAVLMVAGVVVIAWKGA